MLTAPIQDAFSALAVDAVERDAVNPLWGPYLASRSTPAPDLDPDQAALVRRALLAPAVASLGVTGTSARRELRIAVDREGAVVISEDGAEVPSWQPLPLPEVPARLQVALGADHRLSAPARTTTRAEADALRLSPAHRQDARARLGAGASPREVFTTLPGLDPLLRDALISDGDRAVLAVSFHRPARAAASARRFSMVRRWTSGTLSLYRSDGMSVLDGIHPVPDGDVLGTAGPLIAEGIRFARGQEAA